MEHRDSGEILAIQGLSKKFGDTVALDKVDFNLRAGEVHCLVGENGAGKSTLIKILAGAERPDSGSITAFGQTHSRLLPQQSLEAGIATIYQDVELITSLTVADNIFLGREIRNSWGLIDANAQNRKTSELLRSMNVELNPLSLVESLSPAQQQSLQIVKALYLNARILIMDEPTASLGVEEVKALLNLIKSLTAQNKAIIYISHFLSEIFEIGDRVTVLRDGKVSGTFNIAETTVAEVTRSMIGRDRSLFRVRDRVSTDEVILQVRNLTLRDKFSDVSFDLRRGEILGFGGVVGCGRSAVMNVLFGAQKRTSGQIYLHGREIDVSHPAEAIAQGIAMIPEDRKTLGLFDMRSLLENVAIVRNEKNPPVLDHSAEITDTNALVDSLHIVSAGLQQRIGSLSGGNQQKAILARWLLSKASVYIFDEPTKGVDIGAKEEIYNRMIELVKEGKSILMVSSDMPELISMSDRIAVMRNGRVVAQVDARATSEHDLLNHFLGIGEGQCGVP
jgi:ribose transport system ATP-binding protein